MSGVYVIGADMIRFGRFPERSVPALAAEAALLALDDCGLGIRDMQALWCGNLYQASAMVGQRLKYRICDRTHLGRVVPRFGRLNMAERNERTDGRGEGGR